MTALSVAHHRPRHRTKVDHASLLLLRSVMSDAWQAESAGRDLVHRIGGDRRMLQVLRARVARAMLGRPTRTDRRAVETLDWALSALPEPGTPVIPTQRGGHD